MSFLSNLLARIRGTPSPTNPNTQANQDLGFGSYGSTTAILPPSKNSKRVAAQPIMSKAPAPAPIMSKNVVKPEQKKPGFIKKLAKSAAPDTYENLHTVKSTSSTPLQALVAAGKVPVNAPKELILQPAARLVTQLGRQVTTGGNDQGFTPGNVVTKNLLGRAKVEPIDRELESFVRTGYDLSRTYNPGGLSKDDPTSKLFSASLTPFFALAAGGMKALDVEPGGAGGKKVVKEGVEKLAKEGLEKIAKEGAEKLAKEGAEKLAKNVPNVPKMTPKPAQESVPLMSRLAEKASPIESRPISEGVRKPSTLGTEVPSQPRVSESLPTPESSPSPISDASLSYTDKVPPKKDLINLENLGLSDPQKEVARGELDKLAKTSEEIVGKPLTWKEIQKEADSSQRVYADLLTRDDTKEISAQMVNLRNEISADIQNGRIGPDLQDKLLRLKAYGASQARQLGALGINVTGEEKAGFEGILKALQKEGKSLDDLIKSAGKYDLKDPEQLAKWYRENSGRNFEQVVDMLRYNSMLSSPRTHSVNIFSNLIGSAGIAPIQKAVEGGVDAIVSAVTGSGRTAFIGEAPAYVKGYVTSLGEATKNFFDTLSGKALGDLPDIYDIPLTEAGTMARKAENVMRLPMRALEAQDQFFKALTKGGERSALLYKVAHGGKVKNIEKTAEAAAQYRLFKQGLKVPEQGKILDAFDSLSGHVLQLRNDKNPFIRTVAKWSIPFVTTASNTAKQMVEYSPIGFATMWGAANKQEQLSKAIMGTAAATGIATLLGSDRLTGAAPKTTEEANRWKAAGIQPWSVKVGDKWYSYQSIHPAIGMNFALITSLDQALKEGKITDKTAEKLWGTAWNTVSFWSDQSYMKAIGDMNRGLSGDSERAASFFANYPKQMIPFRAFQGWLARSMDDVERQVDPNASFFQKQLQTLMRDIPGLSGKLDERLNPKTGEPIKRQSNAFNNISPVRVTTETDEAKQIQSEQEAKAKYSEFSEEDKVRSSEMKRRSLELYWELKQMEPGEANGRAQALQQSDPQLYERLVDVVKSVKKRSDADAAELNKLNINTGSRARAVWNNLNKLETKEEKNGYLQDLFENKVINKEVMQQIAEIKAKEDAKAPQP